MVRSLLAKFSPKYERRLLSLCLNNPDNDPDINEWNKNAVRYLVRELKKDPNLIDELERAILEKSSHSKCIPVTKASDRRILISHRRGLPHVIFCRLWRWPDLQSHHQIKAISSCESNVTIRSGVQQPSSLKTICINPYHYERNQPKPIEPVLVSIPKIPPDLTSSFEDSGSAAGAGTKARPGNIPLFHYHFQDTSNMDQEQQQQQQQAQQAQQQQQQQAGLFYQQQPSPVPQFRTSSPQFQQQEQWLQGTDPAQQQQQPQAQQAQQPSHQAQQQPQSAQAQTSQQQYGQGPESALQYQSQAEFTQPKAEAFDPQDQQQYQASTAQEQYPMTSPMLYYHSPPAYQQQNYPPQQFQAPVTISELSFDGEIARPYRFKQSRFGHIARARHEQSMVSRYPSYDPHGYISTPYQFSNQPATHLPTTYQSRPALANLPSTANPAIPQHQTSVSYAPTTASSHAIPQQTGGATYTTMYPPQQQAQYSQQEQMQLDYQTEPAMPITNPGIEGTYYGPVAGTSQAQQEDQQMDQAPFIDIQEVPYTEGQYWCSISYHEYDQRIGEKYHSNCRVVSVDGYTQPMCSDRFCIGGISNINRSQFTEWVRRRIGRGVRFTYVDGEVHVEGLSEASVFVSNPLQTEEEGGITYEHVSKLTQGCSAKVFSTQQFSKLLAEAVVKGFESVYKLTSCCVIRVSFVKGWGKNYKRQSIFRTPCWVEVQLNGPLQWIDKALRQMRPPTGCGSTS